MAPALGVLALWFALSRSAPAEGQQWQPRTPSQRSTSRFTTTQHSLHEAEATCVARSIRGIRTRLSFLYETSFAFQGGDMSEYSQGRIRDGGSDMYDDGNMLGVMYTDRSEPLSYTQHCEGFPISGSERRHITCKLNDDPEMGLPALFVAIVVDPKARITGFETAGDLGADGQGRVEGSAVAPTVFLSQPVMGYYKLVNSAGSKPSVNQLVIIGGSNWINEYPTDSNSGAQLVSASRSSGTAAWIIYVLWAGRLGYAYSPEDVKRVMDAFVEDCFSSSATYSATTLNPGGGLWPGTTPPMNEEGDLRLIGTNSEGYLEVYHAGEWGTVCDDLFDDADAMIACRQLGFPAGRVVAPKWRNDADLGRIWLDQLHCYGHEGKLSQCRHGGWGIHDCSHSEDVAVTCLGVDTTTARVRDFSSGGTLRQEGDGPLEMLFDNRWGTICEYGFDNSAAEVACRQLGLSTEQTSVVKFGRVSSPMWAGIRFHCSGTEPSLALCPQTHTDDDCYGTSMVSVRCLEETSLTEQSETLGLGTLFGVLCLAACIAYACYRKCCRYKPLYLDKIEQQDDDEGSDFDVSFFVAPKYWENKDLTVDFDVRCEVPRRVVNTVQQMLQETWRDIQTRDRKDGILPKRLEVINVQRVEDRDMWVKYCTQKERIRQSRGSCTPVELLDGDPLTGHVATLRFAQTLAEESLDHSLNEHYLFHGSSPEGAEGISEHGFQLDRAGQNAGKMFGAGAYFAEMCSKADEYATSGHGLYKGIYAMLLSRVTCGEMCRFLRSDHRAIEQALDTGRFDGVLGDRASSVGTYREFVVYRESQIYPEYVVLYRRIRHDSDDEDDGHDP